MQLLTFVCLLFLLTTVQAQTIYKSIDEQGNVTYSSSAPDVLENIEVLTPPPEPSAEAVEAARQQQIELEQALKESAEKRKKAEQQQRQEQSTKRVNTVIERQYVPYSVHPVRRKALPRNLPASRPVNRPR